MSATTSVTVGRRRWVISPARDGKVMCFVDELGGPVIYVDVLMSAAANCDAIARTVVSLVDGDYRALVEHVLARLEK